MALEGGQSKNSFICLLSPRSLELVSLEFGAHMGVGIKEKREPANKKEKQQERPTMNEPSKERKNE